MSNLAKLNADQQRLLADCIRKYITADDVLNDIWSMWDTMDLTQMIPHISEMMSKGKVKAGLVVELQTLNEEWFGKAPAPAQPTPPATTTKATAPKVSSSTASATSTAGVHKDIMTDLAKTKELAVEYFRPSSGGWKVFDFMRQSAGFSLASMLEELAKPESPLLGLSTSIVKSTFGMYKKYTLGKAPADVNLAYMLIDSGDGQTFTMIPSPKITPYL